MSELLESRSSHRNIYTKKSIPTIVPCLKGQELPIDQDLVSKGLSAIAIKHKVNLEEILRGRDVRKAHVIQCTVSFEGKPSRGIKHRNSFWNVHRPELSKLNWEQKEMTTKRMETLFRHHSSMPLMQPTGTLDVKNTTGQTNLLDNNSTAKNVLTFSKSLVIANDLPPEQEITSSKEKYSLHSLSLQRTEH